MIIAGASQRIGAGLEDEFRRVGDAVVGTALAIPYSDEFDFATVERHITAPATAQRVVEQAVEVVGQSSRVSSAAGFAQQDRGQLRNISGRPRAISLTMSDTRSHRTDRHRLGPATLVYMRQASPGRFRWIGATSPNRWMPVGAAERARYGRPSRARLSPSFGIGAEARSPRERGARRPQAGDLVAAVAGPAQSRW